MAQCILKWKVFLVVACLSFNVTGQTFNGQGGLPVPPGAPGQTVGITESTATVSGIGVLGTGCSYIENVTIDFTHTWVGDIAIFLVAPSGEVLELTSGNGGSGDNFQITEFTDNAADFITAGSPPYNGAFRPEGRQTNTAPPFSNGNPLGTFTFDNTFTGVNADGDWTLLINDYVLIDVGTLNAWSITFSSGGGPAPTVMLGPDVTICPGQSTTLTADVDPAADSYIWNTGATSPSITVSPSVNTTYSVTVTNNDCIDADTIQVIVNPNGVTANAGNDVMICQGNAATLTGSGGSSTASYSWSNGQTGSSITVSPSSTTTYTLTVTDNGCSDTDQVVVTVTPSPIANAGQPVSICAGQSTTLTASGGTQNNQYQWSTGQTGSTITVSPSSTTTYTVTVTINGCVDTDDVQVTVNDVPTVDAGTDIQICIGESATLTASGSGGTYVWSTGQSGASISISPASTTTYTVTVTQNGCTATDDVTVTVGNITAGISPDQSICMGATVTITASGGTSYNWSTGDSGASITVSPTVSTSYTVTVTQGTCSDEASSTITVNPVPEANAGEDESICTGQQITLTATGGTQNNQYQWNTGQTGATITVTPVTTSLYVVTLTVNGCSDTDDVLVTINPGPVVNAGSDVQICAGESATLTATGNGDTFEWSTGETGASITVSPISNTIYTVTATLDGCTATDNVTVTIGDIIAGITPDQSVCEGETVTLTATGGIDYEWSTGQTGSTISVTPDQTTIYTVTVSQGACSDEISTTVTVNPSPVATVSDDEVICSGENVTLTASGGSSYVWSSGQTTSTITVTPSSTTTYTVTVSAGANCSSTASVTVEVNPVPNANAGFDETICEGESITLTATGLQGPGTYGWSSGQNTSVISVTPTTTTTYTVTITNEFNCFDSDAVTVNVNAVPVANAGPDQDMCEGHVVTLEASGGTIPSTYQWSNGQSGSTISVSPSTDTEYTVTVTIGSCMSVDEVFVHVLPSPVADAGPNVSVCAGESTILTASGGGTYQWSIGPTTPSVEVTPVMTTNYMVVVTNASGCTDQDDVTVMVNPSPLADAGIDQTICEGEGATLTGSGGVSYQWSTGESTQSINVTPLSTTSYQLTVTDNNGCSDTDITTILVNAIPLANAGTNVFILPGETTTLNATGGGTYLWSTGETSAQITVSPSVTTTYSVTVTVNGCIDIDDVTVFVNEAPSIDLGQDLVICQGETVTIDGTIQGPFNLLYSWSTGEMTSSITVAPNQTTSYSVTATDQNSGLSTSDTLTVNVLTLPVGDPQIDGSAAICEGDISFYTTDPVAGATTYTWTVSTGATILSGQGTTSIEVNWNAIASGQVQLTVSNTCGSLPASSLNVSIQSSPLLTGPVTGDENPCAEGSGAYSIQGVASADQYQWTVSGGGVITSGQGTTSIVIDWNGSAGGDVCVTASNACGSSLAVCTPVTTVATPIINAGVDQEICGMQTNLSGSGTGVWSFVSGPGTATFADANNSNTTVQVTEDGFYVFSFSASQNGCDASDEAGVLFNADPEIINVIRDCNDINTGYTISFEISGGQSPYVINGSPFSGDIFTSLLIPAGEPYSFVVMDANGCISQEISGNVDCSCTTMAGTMEIILQEACQDVEITANYLGGELMDGNDALAFILHDGTPGGIISWNTTPQFGFVAGMETETTYFISAIVGDEGPDDLPQLSDPCIAISEGAPVIFHAFPEAMLSNDTTVCEGSCADVIIEASGNGNLQIEYNLNDEPFSISETEGIISIPVCPDDQVVFTLTAVQDEFCRSDFDLSTQIDVRDNVFAGEASDISLCQGEAEIISLFELLENEDPGGAWTEVSSAPSTPGAFNAADATFNSIEETAGTYTFKYEIPGLQGCPGANALVDIFINELPVASAGEDQLLGCDPSVVVLDGSGSSAGDAIQYTWTTVNGSIDSSPNAVSVTVSQTGMYILEILNTETSCNAVDTVIVSTSSEVPEFNVLVTSPVCFGDCNGIVEIQSSGNGLLYEFGDGTFVSNNIFTTACSGSMAVSVMDSLGCVVGSSVSIPEPDAIEVDLGPDQQIRYGDSLILHAEASVAIAEYNWFDANACLTCPQIIVSPSSSTFYQVEVSDANGCTATDEIFIEVDDLTEVVLNEVYAPTVFSPNGDGINDKFIIAETQSLERIEFFEVFDRWGNKVFQKINPLIGTDGWDGTFKGSIAASGVYAYLIKVVFSDGSERLLNGDITLLR